MICGHCKAENTTVAHVRDCAKLDRPRVDHATPNSKLYPELQPNEHKVNLSLVVNTKPANEDGMYKLGDRIIKVQKSLSSGHLYAKELVQQATNENDGGVSSWRFEYSPGTMRNLRPEHKMTIEQAKEFGALYGTCCVCGRTLTNEESIEAGIGPICAGKEGWA